METNGTRNSEIKECSSTRCTCSRRVMRSNFRSGMNMPEPVFIPSCSPKRRNDSRSSQMRDNFTQTEPEFPSWPPLKWLKICEAVAKGCEDAIQLPGGKGDWPELTSLERQLLGSNFYPGRVSIRDPVRLCNPNYDENAVRLAIKFYEDDHARIKGVVKKMDRNRSYGRRRNLKKISDDKQCRRNIEKDKRQREDLRNDEKKECHRFREEKPDEDYYNMPSTSRGLRGDERRSEGILMDRAKEATNPVFLETWLSSDESEDEDNYSRYCSH